MFRKRLTFSLICLAVASLLQGLLAWWAIDSASTQIVQGRLASDLLKGHLQLSNTKQRLRSWTLQALLDADASPAQRDQYIADMRKTLSNLEALAQRAAELDIDDAQKQKEWQQRRGTFSILLSSIQNLDYALHHIKTLPKGADSGATWRAINRVFDTSEGQDLRQIVAQTIAHEQSAVDRERAAADSALIRLAGGVLLATTGIAGMAVALAIYFARALRQPLKDLTEGASALQQGQLEHRMKVQGADEFSSVAQTLNAMAEELQAHRMRETQKRYDLEQQVQLRTVELEQALADLQRSDTSRRQLFADISHELRTPTTAILGEAEIALRGQTKSVKEHEESLQRIAKTAKQLSTVISDLLTMSLSDSQSLTIQLQQTNASTLIKDAMEQVQAMAHEKMMTLHWTSLASGDPSICCDGVRICQTLVLLLDNAIRYANVSGQIWLQTDLAQGHWIVRIKDDGIGISAEELPRIFERHFRGEQARRHRADGVGLGLSLALALVRAHGGTLELESVLGLGTTAILRLPLNQKDIV